MKLNLLALLKEEAIKRIVTSGSLQDGVSSYFTNLHNSFYSDKNEVDFDGRYSVDDDEIFIIKDYSLKENIVQAIQNPLTLDMLKLENDRNDIKALICGCWDTQNQQIYFQAFDSRHVLSQKFTLINAKDTFTKLEDPGLIIDERIDATIVDHKLLFTSYHNARKVFDLSDYYKEATNEDLTEFVNNKMFFFEDKQWFIENADSAMRKKVALLQKNNVLGNVKLEEIKKASKGFQITIDIDKKHIVFPKNKKTVKDIIKFLDEDYFITPLTKRKCVTNSKRYLI
jgi:hypothetical protein